MSNIKMSFIGQYTNDLNIIRPSSYFRLINQTSQDSIVNQMLLQMLPKSRNRFQQKAKYQNFYKVMMQKMYRINIDFKYPDQNNLLEKFIENPLYLKIINQIICKFPIISDVRLPIIDLFHQILNAYKIQKKTKKIEIVSLYQYQYSFLEEFKNIKEGMIVESKGFLVTRKLYPNETSIFQKPIKFLIELYYQKQKKGNGYCLLKNDIVIINPFNKFYVKHIQISNMTTKIILAYPVEFPKKKEKVKQIKRQNLSKVDQCYTKKIIHLNKKHIQKQQQEIFKTIKEEKKRIFQKKKQEQMQILKRKKQEQIIRSQNNYQLRKKQKHSQKFFIKNKILGSFQSRDFWILKELNMVYHHFNTAIQISSVWLYENQIQFDLYKDEFQSLCPFNTFSQIEILINHLKMKQQTYHIIITKRMLLPDSVLKILQHHSKSLYLINTNQFQKQIISLRYPDIVVCNNIQTIFKRFSQNLKKKRQFLLPLFANTSGEKSNINSLRLNLQSLLSIQNKQSAKEDFVKLIQCLYQGSPKVQKFIQDYPLDGQIRKILNWYTTPSFYSSLINNFLRMSNDLLELAYIRLPFLDLFNAIKTLYKEQKQQQITQTYRGGIIREEDLNFLINNQGKVIQIYGFMSTSINKDVAESFAGNILFVIKIDKSNRSEQLDYGYANLKDYSAMIDQQQVLFNALNTFKVEKVVKNGNIHEVTLKYGVLAQVHYRKCHSMQIQKDEQDYLINLDYQKNAGFNSYQGKTLFVTQKYDDSLLYYKRYLNQFKIQNQITIQTITINFFIGQNLNEKFNDKEALKYFYKCIQIAKMIPNTKYYIDIIYYNIAETLNNLGFYEKALSYNKKLLMMYQKYQDHLQYKNILSNIAVTYLYLKNYDKALQYYQLIKKQLKLNSTDYFNMGYIYQQKKQFEKALQLSQKALNINIVTYGQNHYKTAICYNQIGQIFMQQQKIQEALKFHHKAIVILSVFDENNHQLIVSYNGIGQIYTHKQQHIKAIFYKQKALKIILNIYGQKYSNISKVYLSIGIDYLKIRNLLKCQYFFLKSLEIQQNIKQNLLLVYFSLGSMYYVWRDMDKSEFFFLKALKMQKQFQNMALIYNHLGQIYIYKNKIEASKKYLQKALELEINLQFHNQNHFILATIYYRLGLIYEKEENYNQSLSYFQKSLNIYRQHYNLRMQYSQVVVMFKVVNKMIKIYEFTKQFQKLLELLQQYSKYELKKFGFCVQEIQFITSKKSKIENDHKND